MRRVTEDFNVVVGVHQGLDLSTFLFSDTKEIHGKVPWCIMFADDIVLV